MQARARASAEKRAERVRRTRRVGQRGSRGRLIATRSPAQSRTRDGRRMQRKYREPDVVRGRVQRGVNGDPCRMPHAASAGATKTMAGSPSASDSADDDVEIVESLGANGALAIGVGIGGGHGPCRNGGGSRPNGQKNGGGDSNATGAHITGGIGMKPGGGNGNGP